MPHAFRALCEKGGKAEGQPYRNGENALNRAQCAAKPIVRGFLHLHSFKQRAVLDGRVLGHPSLCWILIPGSGLPANSIGVSITTSFAGVCSGDLPSQSPRECSEGLPSELPLCRACPCCEDLHRAGLCSESLPFQSPRHRSCSGSEGLPSQPLPSCTEDLPFASPCFWTGFCTRSLLQRTEIRLRRRAARCLFNFAQAARAQRMQASD